MPTTITSELRPSGGDYTSVAAWIAAHGGSTDKDLVTNDDAPVLECYKGDYSGVGGGTNYIKESEQTLTGWTTDATRYLTIKCPDTEKHAGTPGSGFWWEQNGSYADVLTISGADYTRLEDIELRYNATQSNNALVVSSDPCQFHRCIFRSSSSHGSASRVVISSSRDSYTRACLFIYDGSGSSDYLLRNSNYSNLNLESCTFVGSAEAIHNDNTLAAYKTLVRNCVSYDCTEFYSIGGSGEWHADSGYNASSTYTTQAPPDEVGSSNYTSNVVSGDFEDTASDDYHLASGSSLYDIGVDLSGSFDFDIDNDTGIDWSIGMDAGASGGSSPQTVVPGQITEDETLFATTPSTGEVSVSPGLITEDESLFSPSVGLGGGPQTVAPGQITEDETLFTTTPSAGEVVVSPGLITEEESLFSATIQFGTVSVPIGLLTEAETLFTTLGGAANSITISGITGGQNLSSLSYCVFDDADIGAASLIKQGNNESTDANGDLVIDISGLGISSGSTLTVIITDYTTTPGGSNRGAVCYGDAT